jgi:ligand-binding sensor domain-containing protein
MMKYIKIYTLVLTTIFYTSCRGQIQTSAPNIDVKPETKSITNDVPQGITRNIIQDRKGNMWIAAFDGIFHYDGKSFTNITRKKDSFYTLENDIQREMSSARFFSVLEDRKGTIWFGTIGSGVFCYDGKTFKNYKTKDGLINNDITCIYEDKKSNIWFGGSGGASCYNGKSFRNFIINDNDMNEDLTGKIFSDRQPFEVNSIIEDKKGKFWFATRGNTFVYDPSVKLKADEKTFTVVTHEGKSFQNVRTVIEDKKGNIWMSGSDGLWCNDGSKFIQFDHRFVGYIYEDKKGNIWTGGEKAQQVWSLSKYDSKTLSNKKPTATEIATQPMIFGIVEDDKGHIWFGSVNGIHRYDGKTVMDFKSTENQK